MNNHNELLKRITEYLENGGLFNPEYMNHQEVQRLLIDIRDYLNHPPSDLSRPFQKLPVDHLPANGCPRCGITGVTGYVCPDHRCPSRITS